MMAVTDYTAPRAKESHLVSPLEIQSSSSVRNEASTRTAHIMVVLLQELQSPHERVAADALEIIAAKLKESSLECTKVFFSLKGHFIVGVAMNTWKGNQQIQKDGCWSLARAVMFNNYHSEEQYHENARRFVESLHSLRTVELLVQVIKANAASSDISSAGFHALGNLLYVGTDVEATKAATNAAAARLVNELQLVPVLVKAMNKFRALENLQSSGCWLLNLLCSLGAFHQHFALKEGILVVVAASVAQFPQNESIVTNVLTLSTYILAQLGSHPRPTRACPPIALLTSEETQVLANPFQYSTEMADANGQIAYNPGLATLLFDMMQSDNAAVVLTAIVGLEISIKDFTMDLLVEFFNLGGPIILMLFMSKWKNNKCIQKVGCWCIFALIVRSQELPNSGRGTPMLQETLHRCGSIDIIVRTMQAFPEAGDLQGAAVAALGQLFCHVHGDSSRTHANRIVRDKNAVALVVKAMTMAPRLELLQINGTFLLLRLCCLLEGDRSVMKKEALPVVVSAVQNHPDNVGNAMHAKAFIQAALGPP